MTIKYKRGDWVRFMASGVLLIGQVEYVSERDCIGKITLYTTAGCVPQDSVLECRAGGEG